MSKDERDIRREEKGSVKNFFRKRSLSDSGKQLRHGSKRDSEESGHS